MRIEHVGETGVWWIERPRAARISPRAALLAGLAIAALLIGVLFWVRARDERLWPWTTVTPFAPSAAQYLLRYLYVVVGGYLFVAALSAPAWRRLRQVGDRDSLAAQRAIEADDWPTAALHLHRRAVLRAELRPGRPVQRDPQLDRLDALVAPRLRPGRRLFLYYTGTPPELPETPEAGFQPRVVPVSVTGGWWTAAVVGLVGVTALGHVAGAAAARDWRALLNVNFVVEAVVLLGYGYLVVGGLLGRRRYFRFSPGIAELLRFKFRAAATETEAIDLRRCDAFLDVTRSGAVLTLVDRASARRIAEYDLGRSRDVVETCLRAVLSTAPEHPLPRHELTA